MNLAIKLKIKLMYMYVCVCVCVCVSMNTCRKTYMQLRCDAKTVRLAYNIAGLPPKYLAHTSMRYSYLAHSSMRYSQLTAYVTWTDPVWHQVHNFPPYYTYVGEGATLMCVCVCAYSTYLIKHCRHIVVYCRI